MPCRRADIDIMSASIYLHDKHKKGRVGAMSKVEDMIAASKLNDFIHKKDEENKHCKTVLWVLAIVGAVAAVAAIAYAVYCFFTPDYLEDFEEDFEDDFDDDFFNDDDQV